MDAFISGAWRTAKRGEVFVAGSWRRITRAEIYTGGQWRRCLSFTPPMTVAISPLTPSGASYPRFPSTQRVTTQQIRATPTGGAMPYSYVWTVLSGGATPDVANMALTTVSAPVPPDSLVQGNVQVTCTDIEGNVAVAQVPYYLHNYSDNSGGQNQS